MKPGQAKGGAPGAGPRFLRRVRGPGRLYTYILFAACGCRIAGAVIDATTPAEKPKFWEWAQTPPMGWNSWDAFATTVTEHQTQAQAEVMASKLKPFGWNVVTVDIQWYEPNAKSFDYRAGARLTMDGYGRLLPAANRFPSAADGVGFKALAKYIHERGLRFGIHLLRGIPRQAVEENTPILGTAYHASDIADRTSVCRWNTDMYGVDLTKPGAQAYYDSVFALIASWDVDFVKVDDLSRPYVPHIPEIEAIRRAIDHTGRPIVLSLSPGDTPLANAAHVEVNANLWRISDDFWDKWPALLAQFERLRAWAPFAGPGHWPDADMLPLGTLDLGRRQTRFTPDEQKTMLTLWSIARSPLILGADLTKLDEATLRLLTNPEVIAVNQASTGNHQLFREHDLVAWVAAVPYSKDGYIALFNVRDAPKPVAAEGRSEVAGTSAAAITIPLASLGQARTGRVRDLWNRRDLGEFSGEFSASIPPHGAGLYRFTPAQWKP